MKIALILLAAGDSRRFGGNKLLHEYHGKPMYRHLADEVEKLPEDFFSSRIVVTQYEEIGADLKNRGYRVVENRKSSLGISHSIQLALEGEEDAGAYCFAVCDQPFIQAATLKKLLQGFCSSRKGMGCLFCSGEYGNPAIFTDKYRAELLSLTGDVGGRRIIRRHPEDLYLCEVEDPMELVDIDMRQGD